VAQAGHTTNRSAGRERLVLFTPLTSDECVARLSAYLSWHPFHVRAGPHLCTYRGSIMNGRLADGAFRVKRMTDRGPRLEPEVRGVLLPVSGGTRIAIELGVPRQRIVVFLALMLLVAAAAWTCIWIALNLGGFGAVIFGLMGACLVASDGVFVVDVARYAVGAKKEFLQQFVEDVFDAH
jgi:hypothetical protein